MTALTLAPQPPVTEFLDAETGRPESPLRRLNACRDQNSESEMPKIPAETHNIGIAILRHHVAPLAQQAGRDLALGHSQDFLGFGDLSTG
jgi:hypothetical protein